MNRETRKKPLVFSLVIATFLTAIEGTIVSTAMPKIVGDLGGSHLYTWVISVYLLATVITTPIFGKLADLFGRKKMFVIGVIIFLIGSTLSGFSQTMGQLVVFRLVQGIGAGALATLPFTIIGDVFTFEERGKVQALMSSVWGISGIIGPLTGGLIVDTISWHWIFFMNIPFGIISLFLFILSLHEEIEKKKQVIDYWGIAFFSFSMTAFLFALTLLKEENGATGKTFILFLLAALGAVIFLAIEARGKEPMLPLSLFKIKTISILNFSGFLLGFVLIVSSFYIPLWVQGITLKNATMSGIAMMPMSVTWLFGSIAAGKMLPKYSIGKISVGGTFIIALGSFGLTLFQTSTPIPFMMAVTATMGFGYGLAFTTFTVAVQSAVEWKRRGAAMGSHNLMRNLGQAIGISVSGLWLSDELRGAALENGLHSVFILLFVLAVLACGAALLLMRGAKEEAVE